MTSFYLVIVPGKIVKKQLCYMKGIEVLHCFVLYPPLTIKGKGSSAVPGRDLNQVIVRVSFYFLFHI